MSLQEKAQQPVLTSEQINDLIVDAIQDIKGKHIVKIDLRHLDEAPTNFFIICEGDSNTQVQAISNNIYKRLKEEANSLPFHLEGQQHAQWILIDYFDVVIHVFYNETRQFYQLEDLWSDGVFTEYEDL